MSELTVKPLCEETWPAYADLIERHNGVWGGCWCMGFHIGTPEDSDTTICKRDRKLKRVQDGTAHAALVFDGDVAVGWCQYGPARELRPQNKFKTKYLPGLEREPDWRITCFFVDKRYRGKKVSALALDGALEMIAREGGGLVEAYPENVAGRKIASAFICLGTIPMFEKRGFTKLRPVAMHHWVMTLEVAKDPSLSA
ncbi:MAG: GNAT family N-acetyltransferase [Armatimonadetes bacterium]|nr:GNAT family N-acetyltransferase [Armatimonadota bacterium]